MPRMPGGALTPKAERFCEEYLVDLNATQAAIRAGYSVRSAAEIAYRLLAEQSVADWIAELQRERSRRVQITVDRVLSELAICAQSNLLDYEIDFDGNVRLAPGAPKEAIRAAQSIKRTVHYDEHGSPTIVTEIKLWDKIRALHLAGLHLGMFTQKHVISGDPKQPLRMLKAEDMPSDLLAQIAGRALPAEAVARLASADSGEGDS
jgi:phage terminase small subunit